MKFAKILLSVGSLATILSAGGDIASPVSNLSSDTTTANGFSLGENASAGISIGTLGVDAEYTHMISDDYGLAVRLMGGGFSYSGSYEDTDTHYDTDVTLKNVGAVLEYHPLKNGFYIGGGAFYNGNDFKLNAKPNANTTYDFGGVTYDANLVGSVDGKVYNLNTAVPYIGIGYDDSLFGNGNFFFTLKAGAWYQGTPKVSLTAKDCKLDTVAALVPGAPTCNDLRVDLRKEEHDINEDIKNYKWWPVLQIGLSYKF